MRKLKTTIPNGGAPFIKWNVLREILGSENSDAIEATFYTLAKGKPEGFILKGCEVSGTAGSFSISEGYVYLNGKFLRYAGGSGFSTTVYIQEATASEESDVFADGISKAYIDVFEAEDSLSVPVGGQYVAVTFADGGIELADLLAPLTLNSWVTMSIINGWVALEPLQYRVNPTGLLEIRGRLNGSSATADEITDTPVPSNFIGASFYKIFAGVGDAEIDTGGFLRSPGRSPFYFISAVLPEKQ